LPDLDAPVVHSGDFMPNETRGDWSVEPKFQEDWLRRRMKKLKEWLGDRPFLFVAGNHDFLEPERVEDLLKAGGIRAVNVTKKLITWEDRTFYGIPFIPYLQGEWNWERRSQDMWQEFRWIQDELKMADVLLAHCPPSMILDLQRGNIHLYNFLFYESDHRVKAVLSGHVHGGFGRQTIQEMEFCNSAYLDEERQPREIGYQVVEV